MKDTNSVEPKKITFWHALRRWSARAVDNFLFGVIFQLGIKSIKVLIILFLAIFLKLKKDTYLPSSYTPHIKACANYPSGSFMSSLGGPCMVVLILCLGVSFILLMLYVYLSITSRLNAFFMAYMGNTLGKKIFGIKIVDAQGCFLNFQQALKREKLILLKNFLKRHLSFFLILPIIFRDYKLYKNFIKNQTTTWDESMGLRVSYSTQSVWVTLLLAITINILLPILFMVFFLV